MSAFQVACPRHCNPNSKASSQVDVLLRNQYDTNGGTYGLKNIQVQFGLSICRRMGQQLSTAEQHRRYSEAFSIIVHALFRYHIGAYPPFCFITRCLSNSRIRVLSFSGSFSWQNVQPRDIFPPWGRFRCQKCPPRSTYPALTYLPRLSLII